MESQSKTQNTGSQLLKGILIIAISLFACLALVSLVFHFSPSELLQRLADFAEHHFLLFGVFCGVLSIACYRRYMHLTEGISPRAWLNRRKTGRRRQLS